MARRMLIDTTHPEETRVTVVNGNRLEEFDYETATKAQLKGNIYLAKVTRVEPSLQAAFVDYGGNRHGFLAFSEIHPDYYQIPVSDRVEEEVEEASDDDDDAAESSEDGKSVEELGGDEGGDDAVEEVAKKRRTRPLRQYKIQEVIKRRQVLLIQVVKEERGNKGAALTSYLSLAGRYCVLMPNTSRGGGVSRKISNGNDRKRLKSVLAELDTPKGMSVIVRTAGAERSKVEIRRDFDYIFKLWDDIRTKTLAATAPALIHEEASLIKRSIRDLYTKDIEEIQVAGEQGYRVAKDFMKALIPSHARKVQRYKDETGTPLFQRYQVESQLIAIHDPLVRLRSGGSIVIHQTEALVAIDVNSGKATRERHIDDTAYKTNLEAAEEVARQLRLRDLAGLIVIDFIDMDDNKNDQAVERKLKEALRRDRARIQVGRISPFGLLEMSRQRLRPSLMETISQQCPTCGGVGFIQSVESAALSVLRSIEEEGLRRRSSSVVVVVPTDVALYILNHKRVMLSSIESNNNFTVALQASNEMLPPNFELTRMGRQGEVIEADAPTTAAFVAPVSKVAPVATDKTAESDNNNAGEAEDSRANKRNRRRRRGRKRGNEDPQNQDTAANDDDTETTAKNTATEIVESVNPATNAADGEGDSDDEQRKRRKRGRRGGRRRRGNRPENRPEEGQETQEATEGKDTQAVATVEAPKVSAEQSADVADEKESKPRRTRRPRNPRKDSVIDAVVSESPAEVATPVQNAEVAPEVPPKPRRGRPRKVVAVEVAVAEKADETPVDQAKAPQSKATAEEKPKRAKKARAKKSATKSPRKKAAAKETTTPVDSSVAKPVAAPKPAVDAKPAIESKPVVEASKPAAAPEPEKPARKGWWNRVLN